MTVEVAAALIFQNGKFLICQRPATKANALLWEFAGGKAEPGESLREALIRECSEELGIEISVDEEFADTYHQYPDIYIHLTLFKASIISGTPQLLEHNALKWIHPSEIGNYCFCPADEPLLKRLEI